MPGLVAFRRRWSIGSDDLTGPAVTLCLLHIIWVVVLVTVLCSAKLQPPCSIETRNYGSGTAVIMSACSVIEAFMAFVSAKGAILDVAPRSGMPYVIYARGVLLLVEFGWMVVGVQWLVVNADDCGEHLSWRLLAGAVATNFLCVFTIVATHVAVFDSTGGAFAKAKSMQKAAAADQHTEPLMSWMVSARARVADRHLKQLRHKKWERRLNATLCCQSSALNDDARKVFQEVAMLVSAFFEDLDLVLSDVVCGLALLRMYQKHREKNIIEAASNDVYQYLCGLPVSPRTRFLPLSDDKALAEYKELAHFSKYAEACYGWQGYYLTHCCTACCHIGICCSHRSGVKRLLLDEHRSRFTGDNCCMCNYTAILQAAEINPADIVYGCYENEVALPSFFVVLDHSYSKVVVCIRGTLSISDVLTDLLADAEEIQVEPRKPSWLAHKGMLNSAYNIKKKLVEEGILTRAFEQCPKGTAYSLLVVGHSLGAGTAAILAILLQHDYGRLHCYAYSPPGGLLSHDAAKETRSIITAVVLGKDVVSRLGLSQMEHFRADILRVLQACQMPKWKVLCSMGRQDACCTGSCCCLTTTDIESVSTAAAAGPERDCRFNPFSSKLLLSSHVPMFLPGRIVHVVRNYPKPGGKSRSRDPVYQAIWADAAAFDEIVVSPKMFSDHMPNHVAQALQKVLQSCGPRKPDKLLSASQRQVLLLGNECGDLQDLLQRHGAGAAGGGGHAEGGGGGGAAEDDRHSLESGLSWEYTCQSEASVVLRTPSAGQKLLPTTESAHGQAVAASVGVMGGGGGASSTASRTSTIHAIPLAQVFAPVASIEDLRSVTHAGSGTLSRQSSPGDGNLCSVASAAAQGDHAATTAAAAVAQGCAAHCRPAQTSTTDVTGAVSVAKEEAASAGPLLATGPTAAVADQLEASLGCAVAAAASATDPWHPAADESDDVDDAYVAAADARVRRLLASPYSGEHYMLAFDEGGNSAAMAHDVDSRHADHVLVTYSAAESELPAATASAECGLPPTLHQPAAEGGTSSSGERRRSWCDDAGGGQQPYGDCCLGAQHEYSLLNDHYSRAGRGYPHGSPLAASAAAVNVGRQQQQQHRWLASGLGGEDA